MLPSPLVRATYAVAVVMRGLSDALVPSISVYPQWLWPNMHHSPARTVVVALRHAINGGTFRSVAGDLVPAILWIITAWLGGVVMFASAKRCSG